MTNGWQEVPLGKVLKRADRFEKKDEMQTYHFAGTYSFARGIFAGEVKEGSIFGLDKIQRIKKGDFIYCRIMAWEGAFGLAPEKVDNCVMSGAFVAYEVDQTQIYPKFLDYYFKQEPVWKSIGGQSTGTNVRRQSLHPDQFEKATIPFPPLDEQRRIVERIEALATRIEKAQSLREEANQGFDALHHTLMKAACEGKLANQDANDRSMENQLVEAGKLPLASTSLPSLPKGWCWVRAEEICDFITKGTTPSADKLFSGSGEIPFIKVYNLTFDGTLNFSINPTFVSEETHVGELARSKVLPGDVLMNIVGPPLGKVSIVPDTYPEWNMNQAIVRFRPLEFCDRKYLSIVLRTGDILKRAIELAKGTAGQANLTLEICRNLPIPLPPLDEQRRIVAYLDSVQARLASLRGLQSQTQEELDALLPSVLDRAFKGEL